MDPITLVLLVVLAAVLAVVVVPKWRHTLLAPRRPRERPLKNRINGYEMLLLVVGAGGIAVGGVMAMTSAQNANVSRELVQTIAPGYVASDPGADDVVWMWIGVALAIFGLILLVILVSLRAARRG